MSNFSVAEVDEVLAIADTRPVINQVQFSAFEYRRQLLEACEERGVAITAYSSLGTGRHLGDATVAQIAQRIGRTPAQVLLRWCIQHGTIVIPKSTHRERIQENGALFDFELSAEDMAALDDSTAPAGPRRRASRSGGSPRAQSVRSAGSSFS